jgi:hypothetical protein
MGSQQREQRDQLRRQVKINDSCTAQAAGEQICGAYGIGPYNVFEGDRTGPPRFEFIPFFSPGLIRRIQIPQ